MDESPSRRTSRPGLDSRGEPTKSSGQSQNVQPPSAGTLANLRSAITEGLAKAVSGPSSPQRSDRSQNINEIKDQIKQHDPGRVVQRWGRVPGMRGLMKQRGSWDEDMKAQKL